MLCQRYNIPINQLPGEIQKYLHGINLSANFNAKKKLSTSLPVNRDILIVKNFTSGFRELLLLLFFYYAPPS